MPEGIFLWLIKLTTIQTPARFRLALSRCGFSPKKSRHIYSFMQAWFVYDVEIALALNGCQIVLQFPSQVDFLISSWNSNLHKMTKIVEKFEKNK